MYVNVTLRRVLATFVAVEKQLVLHAVRVCLALVIHLAMTMCHIIICGQPSSTIFFPIIS